MPELLQISSFLDPDTVCHFHRTDLRTQGDPTLHSHDFHEVFWIEEGEGWELRPDGPVALAPGMVALVEAADVHGFTTDRGHRCRMANLAFPRTVWQGLRSRVLADATDPFTPTAARRFRLPATCVPHLIDCAEEIGAGARDLAAAERFLLNVLWLIRKHLGPPVSPIPAWLSEAIATLSQPACLRDGTAHLVRVSGRSPAHLAREVRRWYDRTPTDVVNDARIAWAARQLAARDVTPLEICLECGLANLGHFYRLFRARMGDSPSRWADRQRRILQPTSPDRRPRP